MRRLLVFLLVLVAGAFVVSVSSGEARSTVRCQRHHRCPSHTPMPRPTPTPTPAPKPAPTPTPTPSPTPAPSPTPTPANPGPKGSLSWQGYNWNKRSGGTGSPGVGGWSSNNVVSNADGSLTFKLANQTGAEIDSTRAGWGYGTYTVTTNFSPSSMAKNAVWGGLFLYDDGNSPGHNEIDVSETTAAWWSGSTPRVDNTVFTRNHSQTNSGGISVYPSGKSQSTPAQAGDQTYQLVWAPGKLTWKWFNGAGTSGALVQTAVYSGTSSDPVPTPATERVCLNLWAYGSNAGTLNVAVKSFAFVAQ